jgi:F-type H+-transporting ATPase subunit gamma
VGLIVVTSDRGLCGAFNGNIVNETMRALNETFEGRAVDLTVIGRKGVEAFRRRPCTIKTTYTGVMEDSPWRMAGTIIDAIVEDFVKGETDSVYCLYNEFKSAIAQRVTLEQVLPFEPPSRGEIVIDYVYEPSAPVVVGALLARHMQVQMHRVLFESAASEHGARMTAMDAATDNAGEVIERLTLKYNRARQTAITTEMIEIVSGAEAL